METSAEETADTFAGSRRSAESTRSGSSTQAFAPEGHTFRRDGDANHGSRIDDLECPGEPEVPLPLLRIDAHDQPAQGSQSDSCRIFEIEHAGSKLRRDGPREGVVPRLRRSRRPSCLIPTRHDRDRKVRSRLLACLHCPRTAARSPFTKRLKLTDLSKPLLGGGLEVPGRRPPRRHEARRPARFGRAHGPEPASLPLRSLSRASV